MARRRSKSEAEASVALDHNEDGSEVTQSVESIPEEGNSMSEATSTVDPDVDTPDASEVEELPTDESGTAATAAPKAPARPKPEDGFLTPIGFQQLLAKPVAEGGRGVSIRPQQVYSYIRQAQLGGDKVKNPFPVVESNGRIAVKAEDGLKWWDDKEARKANREVEKANKAAADAKKAEEKAAGGATEAEGSELNASAEAVEAE